jgi:hypothetical protein
MGAYDNCFQLWWTNYDADYSTLLTLLPLLAIYLRNSATTMNTQYLCLISAVLFHTASNFYTQALYHVGLMFVLLDTMERVKVKGSNELDCVICVGYFLGLVHPLVMYATLGFMCAYLV